MNNDFKQHPIYDSIMCSKEGFIYKKDIDGIIDTNHDKNRYSRVRVQLNNGDIVKVQAHRLILETFVEIPDELKESGEKILVNHKDGKKGNNRLSNLEWCSYLGNLMHAFKTGLRNDNKPVYVLNYETGEITEYYSLQECARQLKRNAAVIHQHVHSKKNIAYLGKYQFRYNKEFTPKEDMDFETYQKKQRVKVLVKDKDNNHILFHVLIRAAEFMGIGKNKLRVALKIHGSKGYERDDIMAWREDLYIGSIPNDTIICTHYQYPKNGFIRTPI